MEPSSLPRNTQIALPACSRLLASADRGKLGQPIITEITARSLGFPQIDPEVAPSLALTRAQLVANQVPVLCLEGTVSFRVTGIFSRLSAPGLEALLRDNLTVFATDAQGQRKQVDQACNFSIQLSLQRTGSFEASMTGTWDRFAKTSIQARKWYSVQLADQVVFDRLFIIACPEALSSLVSHLEGWHDRPQQQGTKIQRFISSWPYYNGLRAALFRSPLARVGFFKQEGSVQRRSDGLFNLGVIDSGTTLIIAMMGTWPASVEGQCIVNNIVRKELKIAQLIDERIASRLSPLRFFALKEFSVAKNGAYAILTWQPPADGVARQWAVMHQNQILAVFNTLPFSAAITTTRNGSESHPPYLASEPSRHRTDAAVGDHGWHHTPLSGEGTSQVGYYYSPMRL